MKLANTLYEALYPQHIWQTTQQTISGRYKTAKSTRDLKTNRNEVNEHQHDRIIIDFSFK